MTTKEMLKYLYEIWQSVFPSESGERLLKVKLGEWERKMPGFGYPAGWVIWEQSARKYFQVRRSERDDKKDDINVRVFTGDRLNSEYLVYQYPSEVLEQHPFEGPRSN